VLWFSKLVLMCLCLFYVSRHVASAAGCVKLDHTLQRACDHMDCKHLCAICVLTMPFVLVPSLCACRERVRGIYELGGVGGDVPTDMPRALRVGQSVVARHPATRMAADGIVLTIKPSKYRVQFNRCVNCSCTCVEVVLLCVCYVRVYCLHACTSGPCVHACSQGYCRHGTNRVYM
jgi:hypothetical protein